MRNVPTLTKRHSPDDTDSDHEECQTPSKGTLLMPTMSNQVKISKIQTKAEVGESNSDDFDDLETELLRDLEQSK